MPRLRNLFKKNKELYGNTGQVARHTSSDFPGDLFLKCPTCKETIYKEDVVSNWYMCPKCEGYFRVKAKTRIKRVCDEGSFIEWGQDIEGKNPLDYPEYQEKIKELKEKTHLSEAIRIGKASIFGIPVVIGVMDARFLMGSMGYAVGEKITQAFERATKEKLPVILFSCSGGARMQEGIVSLMQMAKTAAAIKKHSKAGLFYLSVLTDPTMGGVSASFAMLGDIILAEPNALIGFAGPRVIAQTIGQRLPEGFQRAEFLVEHGLIDGIVERKDLKKTLADLLSLHSLAIKNEQADMKKREDKKPCLERENLLSAWERVERARDSKRPTALDYIKNLTEKFYTMCGDGHVKDDKAIVGGIGFLKGQAVTLIGIQKGCDTKENIERNFGMPSPEGYKKALRLMKQAEKFKRPIVCFVDTPGAFCGIEAEERGQARAIAKNLMELSGLEVPVLSIIIGEGGSGGALALAVGNEVWMLENAVYSILSPEGFASIIWKDSKKAKDAAKMMKLTSYDLYKLGIIETIIEEREVLSSESIVPFAEELKEKISTFINNYSGLTGEKLTLQRYERFRKM
ncbi:MAG TPA: acetyl-CoA carboxylase, carboxyltransferase subunit beta [Lachnospiraceae bacterium]